MAKIALSGVYSAMLCGGFADMMIFMPAPGDRTDRAILGTLQRDGRIPNIDLAEAVSLSPSACLRRVKALEASGIIEGYHAEISRTRAGLVDLATLSRGADAVRGRLADLAGNGVGAAIIDAVFDRDLETIGGVALDHRLSVGASGIGLGLARALVACGRVKSGTAGAASGAPVGGPAACLAGSCSQATLAQLANAEKTMAVLHLDPEQIVAGPGEVRRALAWAEDRISGGSILIASSSTPNQVAALQSRHGRDAAGHAIEQAMADIAEGLVRSGVRRLVVAGGETSGAVVDRLRIPGFLVGAEIAAGVPVLRAVGADKGEMLLALKSGNFGGTEFFSDALKLMR